MQLGKKKKIYRSDLLDLALIIYKFYNLTTQTESLPSRHHSAATHRSMWVTV